MISSNGKEEEGRPVIIPEFQPRHNYARGDVKAYFDAIFNSDYPEYKGMVSIAAKASDGQMRVIAVIPATQVGGWAAHACVHAHGLLLWQGFFL